MSAVIKSFFEGDKIVPVAGYSFSSERILALGLVTLIASWAARSTRVFLFFADTPRAISAQKVLLVIIKTSNSLTLWTRTFLKPEGSMCLVLAALPSTGNL